MTPSIQLGARVRRRNDIGMDEPGSVVRLKDDAVRVYWPADNFYEDVPVGDLEPYGVIAEQVAA